MAASTVVNFANKVMLAIGEPFMVSTEEDKLPTDLGSLTMVYEALFKIIQGRSSPQSVFDKLNAKALLDGVTLPVGTDEKTYTSNILLGFGVNL